MGKTKIALINPIVEPFTDSRLAGESRVWQNNFVYPGGPTIFMGGFSMRDEDRGGVQRPSLAINHPDGTSATRVIIMDGQDAYEGLTLWPRSASPTVGGTGMATSSMASYRPRPRSNCPSRGTTSAW